MSDASLDVTELRSDFPSLASGIAHFDGPGGTQTPRQVAEAIAATLTEPLSNRGTAIASETNAEIAIATFRSAYADMLAVPATGIVYGRSATQLTYDFARAVSKQWALGDEIVLSRLDHDANVRPWLQAAERAGVDVRWIDIDPETAEIDLDSAYEAINDRTRLVAITAASNLLGSVPPVRAIADAAHAVDALVYVDGVHYTAHNLVDVPALGADLFVCSPYKFLGPHCAVLAAPDPEILQRLDPDKLLPATNVVPERFELGTLPYEIMAGATAAVDYLANLSATATTAAPDGRRPRLRASWKAINAHEHHLQNQLESGIADLAPSVVVHSRAATRTPTLLLTIPGRSTRKAYEFLATRNVLAPADSFYAYEPFRRLALDDDHALRLGLAPYNNDDDVNRVLEGLAEFATQ